jgi:PKD repeat protein
VVRYLHPVACAGARVLALLSSLAACSSDDAATGDNQPPTATLTATPTQVVVGEPVDLSAAGSTDADGFVVAYRFVFADGSPAITTASPGTTHAFVAPGVYRVSLTVVDERGAASAPATATVTVAEPVTCEPGLTPCADGCVDLTSDPEHCGSCERFCVDTQVCTAGGCADPPGTVVEVLPPPAFEVVRGLTIDAGGAFYATTGRRFYVLEPATGTSLGEWFIAGQQTRRVYGLAVAPLATADLPAAFFTGSFAQNGDPTVDVRLEAYAPFGMRVAQQADVGGPCAYDGSQLIVYANEARRLRRFDASLTVVGEQPVTGMAPDDWFTDLALDGEGGAWLVRPQIGDAAPLMKRVDLATGAVTLELTPPSPAGFGGIERHGADLWGLAADGLYRMIP